jgi:hypothetical protein
MTYSVKASRKEVEEKETLKVKILAPLSSFRPPWILPEPDADSAREAGMRGKSYMFNSCSPIVLKYSNSTVFVILDIGDKCSPLSWPCNLRAGYQCIVHLLNCQEALDYPQGGVLPNARQPGATTY